MRITVDYGKLAVAEVAYPNHSLDAAAVWCFLISKEQANLLEEANKAGQAPSAWREPRQKEPIEKEQEQLFLFR